MHMSRLYLFSSASMCTSQHSTRNMTTPLGRARSQIGKLRYVLGKGGRDPEAKSPGDATAACDCSGFVCWALGFDRHQPGFAGYDWVSTDSMVAMARRPDNGWFEEVQVPRPGDLVVYPSIYKGGKRIRVGHVGLVSQVPTGSAVGDWAALRVIHCSAGNQRRTKAAVQETSGLAWKGKGSLFLRYTRRS